MAAIIDPPLTPEHYPNLHLRAFSSHRNRIVQPIVSWINKSKAFITMEPARSLYKNEVDFSALALQSRDFAKQYVNGTRRNDPH